MKKYVKKSLTPQVMDSMRINLSAYEQKLSPEPVCDFCGDDPVVVYAAMRMSTGEYKHAWRWCACKACEALLEEDDKAGVINRIVNRMITLTSGRFSRELVLMAASSAFESFARYAVTVEEGGNNDGCKTSGV
jgi:hypothetical protein